VLNKRKIIPKNKLRTRWWEKRS